MSFQANAQISTTGGRASAALVARAAAGDRDAFATLYNEHQPTVYRYLLGRTRDRYLAEDLTSETFVRALRNIGPFAERPGTGGFAGWLAIIARNLYADHCRASRTRLEMPTGEFFESDRPFDGAEADVMRGLIAAEDADTIRTAMAPLTGCQRECIRLRMLEELSVEETAAVLGKPPGAVRTLTHRAVAAMRRVLADEAVAA
ncbi:sigma-70 family RNA polymerase sigma factor [Streptomyces antibioticus]|uniref:sigma-70 family RNA polymerase sigma factor n=1 Tax=Streptomyces antibioticus TaxID=1890 RepID=UPI003720C365